MNLLMLMLHSPLHTTTTTTIISATRNKAIQDVLTTPITTTTFTIRINTMDTTLTITMIKMGSTIMTPRTTIRSLMTHLASQGMGTELHYWLSLLSR